MGYSDSAQHWNLIRHAAAAFGLVLALAISADAATCDDIETAKGNAYGFRPSQLSPEAKKAKIKGLDMFWSQVKARGPEGLSCLRAMITADTSDGYFAFNAASLLASLDWSRDSFPVVELGLTRTNLDEIDVAAFVRLVVGLIHAGRNIEKLAEKYLRHPKVDTRIASHGGMLLDRDGGGIIIYGSLPPQVADQYLTTILNLPEPHARATAAKLLALSLSEPALSVLKKFPWSSLADRDRKLIEQFVKRTQPTVAASATKSRAEVLMSLARIPKYGADFWGFASDKDLMASAILRLEASDLDTLRDARRRSITGISDEALGEYFALSSIMLGVINRLDLFRALRRP